VRTPKSILKKWVCAISCLPLVACGTFTPNIQEFWADDNQAAIREQDLVRLVRCETGVAIQRVFNQENKVMFIPEPGHPTPKWDMSWFENWGVAMTLTLTVIENTALNPAVTTNKVLQNAVVKFPVNGNVTSGQNFTLAIGGTFSSTATRTDTLHFFYTVKELRRAFFARNEDGSHQECLRSSAEGSLFGENNFKVYEWLNSALLSQQTEVGDYRKAGLGQQGQNGISHEVKFEIVTNGNITPTWKLVDVTGFSGNAPLFGAGRDRVQDLIITMGPIVQQKGQPPQLATAAQNAQLAQLIGYYVAQAIQTPR
jgi:hypothetical protein